MADVSVIVPSYNGRHKIGALLSALAEQTLKPHELIIVVDGSTDGTQDFLKEIQGTGSTKMIVLESANAGRSAARNRGASAASGAILVFFDDDMIPAPNCIQAHVALMGSNLMCVSVGVQVNNAGSDASDFSKYRERRSLQGHQKLLRGGAPLYLTAANVGIFRDLFLRAGGFDESLQLQEDFRLAQTLTRMGVMVTYNPAAMAVHNERITLSYLVAQEHGYMTGRIETGQVKASQYLSTFKSLKAAAFRALFRIEALEAANGLRFLPKFIRYKLYDHIIHSHAVQGL